MNGTPVEKSVKKNGVPMDGKLVIVADLGRMKAYRLDDETQFSKPHLELMEEWQMDAAQTMSDETQENTSASARKNDASTFYSEDNIDARNASLERRFRAVKFLARRIEHLMKREHLEKLFLAADSHINRPILDQVNSAVRSKIEKNVRADLCRVRPEELLQHFCT
jgi:hypothetical protein